MREIKSEIRQGDCLEVLKDYADNTFDFSDIDNLYIDLIESLGYTAKERNEEFAEEYGKCVNLFTKQFLDEFCLSDGPIHWAKVVKLTSSADGKY
jgi:hypothetical protein